jgi:hypothetical protein
VKFALLIHGTDGTPRKSVAEFADFIKFEEVHNISMAKIEDNLKVRDLAWLGWHSEKRRGKTALSFDAWIETVESIAIDSGEEPIVPLEKTQPTG